MKQLLLYSSNTQNTLFTSLCQPRGGSFLLFVNRNCSWEAEKGESMTKKWSLLCVQVTIHLRSDKQQVHIVFALPHVWGFEITWHRPKVSVVTRKSCVAPTPLLWCECWYPLPITIRGSPMPYQRSGDRSSCGQLNHYHISVDPSSGAATTLSCILPPSTENTSSLRQDQTWHVDNPN